ncbi:group II intron reverse transcriptase/maturase [Bacillus toyonensis]|uniref:group II intron reverse transcriptase/maturase n=1 Tax=Bacillus toyonensis TaxID=155322 RepID=UPI002E1C6492|nr:group II intron reverse transcriptase/maturase [Bacillus toyonensis]MED2737083.1 group II intron reverse transcriptase/maturase [Bacillus toyonensis]
MTKSLTQDSAALSLDSLDFAPWVKLQNHVRKLQQRIYRAESLGQKRKVRDLQRLLMRSESALAISIRQTTQLNKGKRTAGVDGFKALTSTQRNKLYVQMKNMNIFCHQPKPTHRVYIPKGKGEKLRPLGIPTVKDRIFQNIVKLALEPQWESHFEAISYGFRPRRSTHDAIEAISNKIGVKSKKKWIFEGDFKGCFDNLDHNFIMERIREFPAKKVIEKWLKAGFVDNNIFHQTDNGTPQGGIISPLLANIALHGMEEEIGVNYRKKTEKKTGRIYHEVFDSKSVVRYADDFVILCESKEEAQSIYAKLAPYLKARGLELASDKTRVVHIQEGFDFLGFNFKHYPVNQEKGRLWKLLVKPSKKSQEKMVDKLKETFEKNKGANVKKLIGDLNPLIRGYANYWRHKVSKRIFSKMDNYIWSKVQKFLRRLHPKKSWKWITERYFHKDLLGISRNRWLLTDPDRKFQLIKMSWTPIVRYSMIQYKNSPFDSSLDEYFEKRAIKGFESNSIASRQKLAKVQRHKCPLCSTNLHTGEALEVHHKTPKAKGGKDEYKNLSLVHTSCHILWHKVFPAKGKLPTEIQIKAFQKMLKRERTKEFCIGF